MAVSADRRCEKACFGLRFRLYHALIWALSCSEMVHIGSRNGLFRKAVRARPKCHIPQTAVYQRIAQTPNFRDFQSKTVAGALRNDF